MYTRLHPYYAEHKPVLMHFQTLEFTELTVQQLHHIYRLRSAVFVVEQDCVYQDIDEKDLTALHLTVHQAANLIAYCRIIPPDKQKKEVNIGRVLVEKSVRRRGLGKDLMRYAITEAIARFPLSEIVISAQCYLQDFYKDLGFNHEGAGYLEDNIPHIKMRYGVSRGSS